MKRHGNWSPKLECLMNMGILNLDKYMRFINVGFQESATWFMSHEIVVWTMIHGHTQTCEHVLDHKCVMQ